LAKKSGTLKAVGKAVETTTVPKQQQQQQQQQQPKASPKSQPKSQPKQRSSKSSKPDDEASLHPSWIAKKALEHVKPAGKHITFD
jgi:hypothetical protein